MGVIYLMGIGITMPFRFEGKIRTSVALNTLEKIKKLNVDVVILENNNLLKKCKKDSLGTQEALKLFSQIIYKQIVRNTRKS